MHILKIVTVLICLNIQVVYGNVVEPDSIAIKVRYLRHLLDTANHMTSEELYNWSDPNDSTESAVGLNQLIYLRLSEVLCNKSIVRYNLDSLLNHNFLQMTHSDDKRLWIFSWYENTGGTFKSNINLVHYRTINNTPKCVAIPSSEEVSSLYSLNDEGASFYHITKLPHRLKKNIYLALGGGIGCSTCCYETCSIIELANDSINLNYDAFPEMKTIEFPNAANSSFSLDSRCGSIEFFKYNPKKLTLSYSYMTDDLTPRKTDSPVKVTGSYQWNGVSFKRVVQPKHIERVAQNKRKKVVK